MSEPLRLRGELTLETVPRIWQQWQDAPAGLDVDLSEVAKIDSAGLALAVALARRTGGRIRQATPATLTLARAYDVEMLFEPDAT